MMTEKEMSEAAGQFSKDWANASYERGQAQPFWIALLRKVFGIKDAEHYISFEKKVKSTTTHYADGYIKESRVLVEHKSADVDLSKPYQHGSKKLTPFQQAKEYDNEVLFDSHARWIITSNFKQFFIYDMNKVGFPHIEIELRNLKRDYRKLKLLIEPYKSSFEDEILKSKKDSFFDENFKSEKSLEKKNDKKLIQKYQIL